MRSITINGIEIEVDDNCELSVDGADPKVTIRAREQRVVHEHYHQQVPQWVQWVPQWYPMASATVHIGTADPLIPQAPTN